MTAPAAKRKGRPSKGQAPMSSTQRNAARRDRLRGDGMRSLSVLITPEAGAALDQLTAGGATQTEVVSSALVHKLSTGYTRAT